MEAQSSNHSFLEKFIKSVIVLFILALISFFADVLGIVGFFSSSSSPNEETSTVATTTTSPPPDTLSTSSSNSTPPTSTTTSTTTTQPQTTSNPPSPQAYLSELEPLIGDVSTQAAFINGRKFEFPVRLDPRKCGKYYAEYDLSGQEFTSFTALAGLSSDYVDRDNRQWTFAIYGDGNPLFKQTMRFGEQGDVGINIAGINRLKIGIEWVDPGFLETCSPWNSYVAVYGDATLHR